MPSVPSIANKKQPLAVFSIASAYISSGLSVVPIVSDGKKRPACDWKRYQSRIATPAEASKWWSSSNFGVAILGGAVSGHLEILDLDEAGLDIEFESVADDNFLLDLLQRCVKVRTPSGGTHYYFRCESPVQGNLKLSRKADGKTLIETRGEGGYVLAPGCSPNCHPTNRTYDIVSGSFLDIPVLTLQERSALLGVARMLDRCPEKPAPAPSERRSVVSRDNSCVSKPYVRREGDLRPGDDYSDRVSSEEIEALVIGAGWQRTHCEDGRVSFVRPGKRTNDGDSANLKGKVFFVFTSNSSLAPGDYSPFQLFAALLHNNNYSAASKDLASKGYGSRLVPTEKAPIMPSPVSQPKRKPFNEMSLQEFSFYFKKSVSAELDRRDDYRWAMGEAYAGLMDSGKISYDEKLEVGKKHFGEAIYQVRHWASCWKKFPTPESRGRFNMTFCMELQGQTEEVIAEFVERSKTESLTREALREALGTVVEKTPTSAARLKEYSAGFKQELFDTVNMIGKAHVENRIKALLTELQELSKANSLPPLEEGGSVAGNIPEGDFEIQNVVLLEENDTNDPFEFDAFDPEYEPDQEGSCDDTSVGGRGVLPQPVPALKEGLPPSKNALNNTPVIDTKMQSENRGTSTINNEPEEDDYSWFTEDAYDLTPRVMFA